jgi:hypothetical protein
MVDIISGEVQDTISPLRRTPSKSRGRAGGLKGGKARAAVIPDQRRSEIAQKAAQARWKRGALPEKP